MDARSNVRNLLQRRPYEWVAFHDNLWGDTLTRWTKEGYPTKDSRPEDVEDHFGFDIVLFGGIDPMPIRGCDEVIEETETWAVRRNGAGAVYKYWKHKSGVPEHVAFDLTSREVWDARYRSHLLEVDPERIAFHQISERFEKAREQRLFLLCHNAFL